MVLQKVLPFVLSALQAMAVFSGVSLPSTPRPEAKAAIVAPMKRFGQGRLFVPADIRASGNEIIVLDEVAPMTPGDNKFVVFDMDGRWKSEFGRGGQGPGEFGQAHAFEIKGNVISVLDSYRQCIQEFSVSDKRFLRSIRYGAEQSFTTPHDFTVLDGGGYILAKPLNIRGYKTLFPIGPDGKPGTAFLDVLPAYETFQEFMAKANDPDPDRIRNTYVNLGYLESSGRTVCYLSWLRNEILVFDSGGKAIGSHVLPLSSLEKTVPIIKQQGYSTIERRLNYGLSCAGDRIWVLSRDEDGVSILYEIAGGRVTERLRAKEALQDFVLVGDRMYAIDQDAGEVLVYPLPPARF